MDLGSTFEAVAIGAKGRQQARSQGGAGSWEAVKQGVVIVLLEAVFELLIKLLDGFDQAAQLSDQGWDTWRAGMAQLAAQPNVASKTSAFGTFIHRNDPAHVFDVLTETVTIFGADRCLFGSNFPIEKLWTTYRELVDAYIAATASLRADQRDAVLRTTASRVYRLGI